MDRIGGEEEALSPQGAPKARGRAADTTPRTPRSHPLIRVIGALRKER
jgi:hypothetical protein